MSQKKKKSCRHTHSTKPFTVTILFARQRERALSWQALRLQGIKVPSSPGPVTAFVETVSRFCERGACVSEQHSLSEPAVASQGGQRVGSHWGAGTPSGLEEPSWTGLGLISPLTLQGALSGRHHAGAAATHANGHLLQTGNSSGKAPIMVNFWPRQKGREGRRLQSSRLPEQGCNISRRDTAIFILRREQLTPSNEPNMGRGREAVQDKKARVRADVAQNPNPELFLQYFLEGGGVAVSFSPLSL